MKIAFPGITYCPSCKRPIITNLQHTCKVEYKGGA